MKKIFLAFLILILISLSGCNISKKTALNPLGIDINNVVHIYFLSESINEEFSKELSQEEVKSIIDLINSAESWEEYKGPQPKGKTLILSAELKPTKIIELYKSELGFIAISSFGSYSAKQSNFASVFDRIFSRIEQDSEDKAVIKVIEYHNSLAEVQSDYDFPITIKEGDTVTKEVKVGGPAPGTTLNLEMKIEVEKEGDKYIVILKEDYNIIINGKDAISYWKYELSDNGIKLLDKKENGNLIKIIK